MGTISRTWVACCSLLLVSYTGLHCSEEESYPRACFSLAAPFIPFYRLVGPYQCAQAPKTVKTELWETVARRGILGNLIIGVIPMIFYMVLNSLAYVAGIIWTITGRPLVSRM